MQTVHFKKDFLPGSVIVLKTSATLQAQQASDILRTRFNLPTVETLFESWKLADSLITNKTMLRQTQASPKLFKYPQDRVKSFQSLVFDEYISKALRVSSPSPLSRSLPSSQSSSPSPSPTSQLLQIPKSNVAEAKNANQNNNNMSNNNSNSNNNHTILSPVPTQASLRNPIAPIILGSHTHLVELEQAPQQVSASFLLGEDRELMELFKPLTLLDLNYILFRCNEEELNDTHGQSSVYVLDNYGPLLYAGLHGIFPVLCLVRNNNDLGHSICDNLRRGNWLMDYCTDRLARPHLTPAVHGVGKWLKTKFDLVKALPRHLIPTYFDVVISWLHSKLIHHSWNLMSEFVSKGSVLTRTLALGSIQMFGALQNTPLLAQYPGLLPHARPGSLAAGLPHFASGYMRCWGRDTFISLRGLLLVTGRFQEAREIILSYATTLRHGIIPNLLNGGFGARYNARDATWWFLQAVQDYCCMAPEGTGILSAKVVRLFPNDSQEKCAEYHETIKKEASSGSTAATTTAAATKNNIALGVLETSASEGIAPSTVVMTLEDVIQEILQKHAAGIRYREWNEGKAIDEKMTYEGFEVTVRLDRQTGFIFGGNTRNCGTWMDKMGESYQAGNYGVPATPRDGADIEIIGLLKSTVRWLTELYKQKKYRYEGVTVSSSLSTSTSPASSASSASSSDTPSVFSYQDWNSALQRFFEPHFWIPQDPSFDSKYVIDSKVVNQRGIYKDIFGSASVYADYQLRPNQCVAMVVAPELFDPSHVLIALEQIETKLLGPLGMKTLDSSDWKYRGDYINGIDSTDYNTSRGFNYHQGPEWLWPTGYYLRAWLKFSQINKQSSAKGAEEREKSGTPDTETPHLHHHHIYSQENNYKLVGEEYNVAKSIISVLSRYRKAVFETNWWGLPELTNKNGAFCGDSCAAQAWSSACILDAIYDVDQVWRRR